MANKTLYVLTELTGHTGPAGVKGFQVTGAVENEDEALRRTFGNTRCFAELEEVEPGVWIRKPKKLATENF